MAPMESFISPNITCWGYWAPLVAQLSSSSQGSLTQTVLYSQFSHEQHKSWQIMRNALYFLIQKSAIGFTFPSSLLSSEFWNHSSYRVSPRTERRIKTLCFQTPFLIFSYITTERKKTLPTPYTSVCVRLHISDELRKKCYFSKILFK